MSLHRLQLLPRANSGRQHRLDRPSIFLLEPLDQVQPVLNLSLSVGIRFQLFGIVAKTLGEIFELNRRLHGLLPAGAHRPIRLSQLRKQTTDPSQSHQRPLLIGLYFRIRCFGQFAEAMSMGQPLPFRLQRLFLIDQQYGLFDFLRLEP